MSSPIKTKAFLTLAVIPLILAGCDGYVPQPYHGTPYQKTLHDDDARTAGFGVEYVRAHLAPPAPLNVTPQTPPPAPKAAPPPPAPAPAPMTSAAPVFHKAVEK